MHHGWRGGSLAARIVLGEGEVLLREGLACLLERSGFDVAEFLDTLQRVAKGGSVVDPALVRELVTARRRDDPLAVLTFLQAH
jgi:hypothetical protein